MTQSKVQDLADKFTNETMTALYGERFTALEDVEDDEELNRVWDNLNAKFYEAIINIL